MLRPNALLRRSRHVIALAFWLAFVGVAMWHHAQRSSQPPIYDASTYFLKAFHFWGSLNSGKLVNPLNLEPTFRPPGTVLMSYPAGFDKDYRGFYFRSIFLPIALLAIAVLAVGYRRDLENKAKWHLVLLAAFLSSLPAFYYFEVSPDFPAPSHWGLVDNFLGGVAALAVAAMVRSVWRRSSAWLVVTALLASFCVLIKPAGAIVMAIIGLIWFGLAVLRMGLAWHVLEERRSAAGSIARGGLIFGIPYIAVLVAAFSSNYLSPQNLAFGSGAIVIMQTELPVSRHVIQSMIHMGLGYPFLVWALCMALLLGRHLWRMPPAGSSWSKPTLVALVIASFLVFAFGIWFWILGSGGAYQIRYCVPFVLMSAILAVPAVLQAVPGMSRWELLTLSFLMAAPAVNISLLLAQTEPSIAWQKWSGVNMSSGVRASVIAQAEDFVARVKREGRDVVLYSMSMNVIDAEFQSVVGYAQIAAPPMPMVSIGVPGDSKRPTTYRIGEMLSADYWLFEPVRDQRIVTATLATQSIAGLDHERAVFQAWATQLTPADGVEVVSDSATARILRITDSERLESALDALVAAHSWRDTFTMANPKNRLSEKDLLDALARNPPTVENIRFGDRIELRALSVSRVGSDTAVRLWWRPLPALRETDWVLFVHSIDDAGEMVLANYLQLNTRAERAHGTATRFDMITFRTSPRDQTHRLAIGFVRPNQTPLVADKGPRDWNGMRLIVPMP